MERIVGSVEWVRFERLLSGVYADSKGRPSYPPIVLFKCLLLQQWYRLSDPGLEEAVADPRVKPEDLSFRRFVGLALHDDVPDHSTISRFRTRLGRLGLVESLFDELERQLAAAGLILKQGTLIDATVVQADATPYSHERAAERSDKDAGFTLTRRGYRLGYKAHVAMDAGSRLIRRAILTPANRHESHWPLVRHLVQGDEAVVYADTAYDTREIRADLVGPTRFVGRNDPVDRLARRGGTGPVALNRSLKGELVRLDTALALICGRPGTCVARTHVLLLSSIAITRVRSY